MADENKMVDENEEMDVREVAAERLAYLSMLQLQLRRRTLAEGAPWRDARQGQGRALALLKMKPEMTQRDLTHLLGMSRSAVAQLLTKLEKQGLITREASEVDKRVVVVRLTEAGLDAEQSSPEPAEDLAQYLCDFSDEEISRFADYLQRLIDRLEPQVSEDMETRRWMAEEFWAEHGWGERGPRGGFGTFPGRGNRPFGGFRGRRSNDGAPAGFEGSNGFGGPEGSGNFGTPEGFGFGEDLRGSAPEGMPGAERFSADYDGPTPKRSLKRPSAR